MRENRTSLIEATAKHSAAIVALIFVISYVYEVSYLHSIGIPPNLVFSTNDILQIVSSNTTTKLIPILIAFPIFIAIPLFLISENPTRTRVVLAFLVALILFLFPIILNTFTGKYEWILYADIAAFVSVTIFSIYFVIADLLFRFRGTRDKQPYVPHREVIIGLVSLALAYLLGVSEGRTATSREDTLTDFASSGSLSSQFPFDKILRVYKDGTIVVDTDSCRVSYLRFDAAFVITHQYCVQNHTCDGKQDYCGIVSGNPPRPEQPL